MRSAAIPFLQIVPSFLVYLNLKYLESEFVIFYVDRSSFPSAHTMAYPQNKFAHSIIYFLLLWLTQIKGVLQDQFFQIFAWSGRLLGAEKGSREAMQLQYNNIIALGAMQRKQSRFCSESVEYSHRVHEFLSNYKVEPCPNPLVHFIHECPCYHSREDRRRNPYLGCNLLYYPTQMLCLCEDPTCKNAHNTYEVCFHPFVYKASPCQTNCQGSYYCFGSHPNELPYLQKHQFFRFDLQTFKTTPCQLAHSSNNQYATCRFYHGEGDRRRDVSVVPYSHLECAEKGDCGNRGCLLAHNKIEQLYHPQRYKSKYCSRILKKEPCEYLEFCSFAHSDEELTIELLHKELPKDPRFYYYKFKTVWCPFTENHERASCDYAHNFNDYRRDPTRYKYETGDCPSWNKNKIIESLEFCGCEKKLECNKCHGWYENKCHPDNLLKSTQGEEEKPKMSQNKPVEQPRRQDGLGTGAPFYRIEEKKEVKQKKGDKGEGKEQREPLEEEGFPISKRVKGRKEGSKKSNSSFKKRFLFYHSNDGNMWLSPLKAKSGNNSPRFFREQCANNENESKCFYTASFKKLLAQFGLQEKLLQLGIHQITLQSLSETEIQKQKEFEGWSPSDRTNLVVAISKYNESSSHLTYSKSFVRLFRSHQCRALLDKLNTKKIDQKKLLALSQNSINKLSFLAEQEKEKLPVILENYTDERDFRELNARIKDETNSPT